MENSIELKSIGELLGMNFFIPSYQRGYRWTEQQVKDLLEDIDEFDSINGKWYCLQPVVVKEIVDVDDNQKKKYSLDSEKDNNRWYEVIDGQQRLTTVFLIIHYFNEMWVGKQKISELIINYETRTDSGEFLRGITVDTDDEVSIDDTNIDYWHISNAYASIHKWMAEKKPAKPDQVVFKSKFQQSTKVIWYETSEKDNSIDIFTRINSGKIPLTNAELIKALFLNSSNFPNADKDKIRLKQLEIASEWDRIEYALQNDSFWYFINKNENKLATRIEFIFNLMYEVAQAEDKELEERKHLEIKNPKQIEERKKTHQTVFEKFGDDKYSTFRFFNEKLKTKSKDDWLENNWLEIKKCFQTLEEWYNDRELYHKIGYLIAVGTNIKDILKEKMGKSKTEFANWVNQKIQSKFKKVNLGKVEYNNGPVREILLLHNIQTMLNNKNETNRFPFDRYKKEFWDVEHIHAIATEVKVKKEVQADWLKKNFVKTDNHQDEDKNNQIEQIINSKSSIEETEFDYIIDYVLGEEDDSLQNLCLLDRRTNRSYKNDSFKEKRKKIIEREMEGTFIPICTKNVFMKYYSNDVKDIEVWNEADRKAYLKKTQNVISQYLPQTEFTENE